MQEAAFHLARCEHCTSWTLCCDHIFRLILYLPKLALHRAEAFELLCFSCGVDGRSSSHSVSGCVEALFYMALSLQLSHVPLLPVCVGVDAALSVEHNAVVLLRSAVAQIISICSISVC